MEIHTHHHMQRVNEYTMQCQKPHEPTVFELFLLIEVGTQGVGKATVKLVREITSKLKRFENG